MAAEFKWIQTTGAAGSEIEVEKTDNSHVASFQSIDTATEYGFEANPISAGDNSYEIFLQGEFSGTFTKIENLKIWKSSGTLGDGVSIKYGSRHKDNYMTPVDTISVIASTDIPNEEPTMQNVGVSGDLSGSLTAPGRTDYLVTQLQTTASAVATEINDVTYTLFYDES